MTTTRHAWSAIWLGLSGCVAANHMDTHEPSTASGGGPVEISGVLKSESGKTLSQTTVMGCMTTSCLFAQSDAQGAFTFMADPQAKIVVKTLEDLKGEPKLGATMRPLQVDGAADKIELGTVYVPELPPESFIDSNPSELQTMAAGDGLELTFRSGDIEPHLGDVFSSISARRVRAEQIPAFPELTAQQIVAVYALHPFAARSHSPIAVRAALDSSNLPADAALEFRTVSELDGSLSEPVRGLARAGFATTELGAGISKLSWLVISR